MSTLVPINKDVEQEALTAEEFLDWLQPEVHADLIGGTPIMHSPVSFRHGTLLTFVQCLMHLYIRHYRLGRLDRETVAIKFDARNVFLPDLCFFTNEQAEKLFPNHADFAPSLVVEVLSPATAQRDVGIKFTTYERHGVREYWVLDPQTSAHRLYALEGDVFVEFAHGEERIVSRTLPGFFVERAWLDPINPPLELDCFRKIVGESAR